MWYHNFFHGLPQEAWRAAQTNDQTQLDLELIVETLEFGPGDAVLDIFCGYGRHALPLARMGAEVMGIDISEEYIQALQTDAKAGNWPIKGICADFMTTRSLDKRAGQFDAAYCLGNSFAFFPHDDMLRFLQRIARLLRPNGRLLIQSSMVAEVVLPDFQERNWMPVGEAITVLIENEYDAIESRIDQHLTYIRSVAGEPTVSEKRTAQYYLYTIAELVRLFTKAGFITEALYGTADQQPFMVGDEGVWMVVKKA